MLLRSLRTLGISLCVTLALGLSCVPATAAAASHRLDRVFVIMMENQGFDGVIGHLDATGTPDTPFITTLAQRYGLQTYYFGVTHPSLPNYLASVAGSYFGIQDDNDSCYTPPSPPPGCHTVTAQSLVDQLESHNISWNAFEQTMPSAGYLGDQYPPAPSDKLYAQKHNPFVYFKDIATNPARLARILPLDAKASQLAAAVAMGRNAPRFSFIVPDQCHDMHGTGTICPNLDALLHAGDAYVRKLVETIAGSSAYTQNSAIILTWDENDYTTNLGERLGLHGGGHVATIVITPKISQPLTSSLPTNHYSLLATIEDGFGLPRMNLSVAQANALFDLIP